MGIQKRKRLRMDFFGRQQAHLDAAELEEEGTDHAHDGPAGERPAEDELQGTIESALDRLPPCRRQQAMGGTLRTTKTQME